MPALTLVDGLLEYIITENVPSYDACTKYMRVHRKFIPTFGEYCMALGLKKYSESTGRNLQRLAANINEESDHLILATTPPVEVTPCSGCGGGAIL